MGPLPRCIYANPHFVMASTELSKTETVDEKSVPSVLSGFWTIIDVECRILRRDGPDEAFPYIRCTCPERCKARIEGEPYKGSFTYPPAQSAEDLILVNEVDDRPVSSDTEFGMEPKAIYEKKFRIMRFEALRRDGYRCVECGAPAHDKILDVHHVIPRSEGGSNEMDNLRTLCNECHRKAHMAKEEELVEDAEVNIETNTRSPREEIFALKELIHRLRSTADSRKGVAQEDIFKAAEATEGMTEDRVKTLIKRLSQNGEVYSPVPGFFKLSLEE